MRYACLIYYDPQTLFGGSPEAQGVLAECSTYDEVLTVSGHFIASEALTLPNEAMTVRMRGGRVVVDVIDNGRGIPKEAQSTIFEKFTRLPNESRAKGAGLGLAICREIVANLGGSIAYLPGQGGAAFRVILPLRLEQRAA